MRSHMANGNTVVSAQPDVNVLPRSPALIDNKSYLIMNVLPRSPALRADMQCTIRDENTFSSSASESNDEPYPTQTTENGCPAFRGLRWRTGLHSSCPMLWLVCRAQRGMGPGPRFLLAQGRSTDGR